jgi:hypothetical protein
MATVVGARFILATFGRGCYGGVLISRGVVISVGNEKFFMSIEPMSHEKSTKYEIVTRAEFEAARELPRMRAQQVCTTHDGGPDWPDCYAGHFAWLLNLPDGRNVGMLMADADGNGEELFLKGMGVV